jgi:hypothetical protein
METTGAVNTKRRDPCSGRTSTRQHGVRFTLIPGALRNNHTLLDIPISFSLAPIQLVHTGSYCFIHYSSHYSTLLIPTQSQGDDYFDKTISCTIQVLLAEYDEPEKSRERMQGDPGA